MRIRYGKPVKVKSLLGRCNIPYTYDFENVTFYPLSSGTFIRYAENNLDLVKVERKANHSYFILLNAEIETYSWSYFGIWDTYSTGYDGNSVAPTKDGNNYYALITPSTGAAQGVPTLQFGVTTKNKANYAFIIDLTESSLDHLTAEQFYNKYKNKFELIATGKEVLLDNGSGKLPISRLPAEYQEIEYIEGDGNQYMGAIRLNNIEIKGDLTFGCKFKVNEHSAAMYFSTITSSLDRGQTYSLGYTGATSPLYLRWNQQADTTTSLDYNVGDICEIVKTNNTECTLHDYSIFCHGTNYGPWKGRCYYYYLKLNEKYIFNWIPCYRKSDSVIGMYDLVSKTFITNLGSGSFTKGNNVNNIISCKIAGGSSDVYIGMEKAMNLQ